MTDDNLATTIAPDRTLTLPPEAVAVLGLGTTVYIMVDPDKKTVTLSPVHPDELANNAILDQLAELNEGMSLEEYSAPVPDSFLHRRGKTAADGDAE